MKKSCWIFDSEAYERLQELTEIISPSMEEVPMASYLRNLWEKKGLNVITDVMGNIHGAIGEEGDDAIHIGLIAHMDTVAIQITRICPNGLLQFRHIGLRPHVLLGQPVKVLTGKGIIEGVIGFDPTSQYGQPKGLIEEDLWLDIGAYNYENALSMVNIGDLAIMTPQLMQLNDKYICGTGLDDRIGLFIINECMNWFVNNSSSACLHFMGSTQEEIGLRGAGIIASQYHLDACFVIDVDYATDTLTSHDNQMGVLLLGKGVGLHIKSDNNPVLRKLASKVGNEFNIAYQSSLGRFLCGGTDATSLQLQSRGIATMNINIPCRYMHSPIEICHKNDIESAIRLLINTINRIGETKQHSFIPGIDDVIS